MRTITQEHTIYKFGDCKEVDEKIKDYILQHWDIYEHCMEERIETLKEFAELLQADLDYSLSCVPDRGEFIKITPKHEELNYEALWEVINQEKQCPLTGCYYDHDLIDHLSKSSLFNANEKFNYKGITYKEIDGIKYAFDRYIAAIHEEYEAMTQHDYIYELCESNEYEFYNNGRLI